MSSLKSTSDAVASAASKATTPVVPTDIAQAAEYWASQAKKTAIDWDSASTTKSGGSGGNACDFIGKVFTAVTQLATGNFVGAGKTLLS
jgi:hypothetical protein